MRAAMMKTNERKSAERKREGSLNSRAGSKLGGSK